MTPRTTISAKRRAECFRDNDGLCHLCSRRIGPGEPWQADHVKPLGLNGVDDATNLRPAHIDCHAGKTRSDVRVMRKADRQMKAHFGTRKPAKMAGSRNSKFKKTMSGKVEIR